MKIKTKHIICCIKCLFLGLVMALPFIAVLPTALYYGFNQYATTSNKIEYEYQTNEVKSIDDIKVGNVYLFNYSENYGNTFTTMTEEVEIDFGIEYTKIEIYGNNLEDTLSNDLTVDETYNSNTKINKIYFPNQFNNYSIFITSSDELAKNIYYIISYMFTNNNIDRNIYLNLIIDQDFWDYLANTIEPELFNQAIEDKSITKATYLGEPKIEENITNLNALEIAFDSVFNSNGFSWVKNSIIAKPVYAFVGAFGLTNELFISNLIVYWTNILLIYAILNIVIVCFTKLTTLGQKKDKD